LIIPLHAETLSGMSGEAESVLLLQAAAHALLKQRLRLHVF
jgi:hypothetical protein